MARCLKEGCPDPVISDVSPGPQEEDLLKPLTLPLLGEIDPKSVSLPFFTIVIAALDSFNPCAFFVLLFLLSLLVHARSRRRMIFIGSVFILFSGIIYFLFMAAWLNIFMAIGSVSTVTTAGGIAALLIGIINIKDFFLFRQGVSLSIPESAKPKLFARMRGLLMADSLSVLVSGTVMLAIAANAYEALCTAGFPMVYTRVLTLQEMPPSSYYRYLVFYNIVYVTPLALIVAVMTTALGARKMTEWQGRKLKLISGLMMASLGVILMLAPALLGNLLASFLLLAGIAAVAGLIISVTRRLRPEVTKEIHDK
ncbi:MAG: hypothetical protein RQ824_01225 [bacterium]|nr:hypothetical protein [bacterium]